MIREVARQFMAEAKAEIVGAPAPAPTGGPPASPRIGNATLLVLAFGGAFLVHRGETTRDMVAASAVEQGKIVAAMDARLAAVEDERAGQRAREARRDDAFREALFVLAEDSRAVWDALESVHENTKPAGAAPLRKPTTSSRLTGLRDTVGRGE